MCFYVPVKRLFSSAYKPFARISLKCLVRLKSQDEGDNLQVVHCEGNALGSVLAHLDYCVTPLGKRMLRSWLTKPLRCCADIHARQDAVGELLDGAAPALESALSSLRCVGDIERDIMRLAAASAGAMGRDAPRVVLYEDSSKRKVRMITSLLRGLQGVRDAVEALAEGGVQSAVLKGLTTWGQRMPDFRDALEVRRHCFLPIHSKEITYTVL
jgi:DNA mismatch repair ATPase MutS